MNSLASIDGALLRQYLPFQELDPELLLLVQRCATSRRFERGEVLFELDEVGGEDYFLVTGSLSLIARDGVIRRIQSDSPHAKGVLSHLRPRQFRAVGDQSGQLLCFPAKMLERLHRFTGLASSPCCEVETPADDDARVYASTAADLVQRKLKIPVSRQGAIRVRALLNSAGENPRLLAQAAMLEPALCLRLIAAANHPAFFDTTVQSCLDATLRLGARTTRQILLHYSSSEHVPDRYSTITPLLDSLVYKAQVVAFIAVQLAELTTDLLPAKVFEMALLHNIGEIIACAYAEHLQELVLDEQRWQPFCQKARVSLGKTVLQSCGLAEEFVASATVGEEWWREALLADYADLVLLARLHSVIGTPAMRSLPPLIQLPLFQRISGGELSPARSMAILRYAKEQAGQVPLPQSQVA